MAKEVTREPATDETDAPVDPGGAHNKGYSADSGPDNAVREPDPVPLAPVPIPIPKSECPSATTTFNRRAARNCPTMSRLRFDGPRSAQSGAETHAAKVDVGHLWHDQIDQHRLCCLRHRFVAGRVAHRQAKVNVRRNLRRRLPIEAAVVRQLGRPNEMPLRIGRGSFAPFQRNRSAGQVLVRRLPHQHERVDRAGSACGLSSVACGGVTSNSTRICGGSLACGPGLPKPARLFTTTQNP